MITVTVEYNGIRASKSDPFWKNYPYKPEKLRKLAEMAYTDAVSQWAKEKPEAEK